MANEINFLCKQLDLLQVSVPNVSKYFKQGRGDLLSFTEGSLVIV
jgi:hypothetical protein